MVHRILLLLALCWPLGCHADWYYVDLQRDKPAQIVLRENSVESHFREDATACPDSSPYFCIRSKTFSFAVPKRLTAEKQWTVNAISYRVTSEQKIAILGKEDDLLLIDEVTKDGAGLRFLYSRGRGLVGIWHSKPQKPGFFILQNACGFGAPPGCSETK